MTERSLVEGLSGCVSIMMPAFNAERYIAQAIESALAQTYRTWELIVVDDGSADRTGEIAAEYRDPRIKVVRRTNGGEAAARNTALEHAGGEYIAFLDADDLFMPHHLEAAVAHLESHTQHAGVYSDGYYISEDGRRLMRLSGRRTPPRSGRVFDEVVRTSAFFGPPLCLVLRHAPIKRYQLRFSEEVGLGTDWDFFARFADVAQFGYVDRVTCEYRVHVTNLTRAVGARNRLRGALKCRMNAVQMESFAACREDVRVAVLYDLLVNLLRDCSVEQEAIVQRSQFRALPSAQQARLLRLIAARSLADFGNAPHIRRWLVDSRRLDGADWRGAVLFTLYRASPALCRTLLRLRVRTQPHPSRINPFWDLDRAAGAGVVGSVAPPQVGSTL